jgi:hypothetical protein
MAKNLFLLVLLLGLTCGCRTTLTNLTPSQMTRNTSGLYPFEVAWDTTMRSIQEDTIKACVLVGHESYPMQRTPKLEHRWEAFVPVPADKVEVHYRFKFDYQYLSVPERRNNSRMTPQYQLRILNR